MAHEAQPAGGKAPRAARVAQWAAAAAVFLVLAARTLSFVRTHAVNVLYWDQWDFYEPLFREQGAWALFDRQHGPHREGLGLLLTQVVARASGWDCRWEAYSVWACLGAGAVAAGILAARSGLRGQPVALIAAPLACFNVHAYEVYVGAVNLSYAAVPVAGFMAGCLFWTARDARLRLLGSAAVTFPLVFTGFGLFAGVVFPVLAALEGLHALRGGRRREAALAGVALAAAAATWALFLRGYTFQPAVPGFRFPYEHPAQYGVFMARLAGYALGLPILKPVDIVLGGAAAAVVVAAWAWAAARCLRRGPAAEPAAAAVFALAGFSLLFGANCAVGRVFTSDIAPYASRYVVFQAPALVAVLIWLAQSSAPSVRRWGPIALALVLVPATTLRHAFESEGADWYSNGKAAWRRAYLRTGDQAEADRASGFRIYPADLGERLTYLKMRHLNLFGPESGK